MSEELDSNPLTAFTAIFGWATAIAAFLALAVLCGCSPSEARTVAFDLGGVGCFHRPPFGTRPSTVAFIDAKPIAEIPKTGILF